jgi:tRNA threonylcarbamoyladenosine biosynthesis protein TsaE
MSESIALADAEATRRCGERLGAALIALNAGLLIGLSGDLGAGKTTFVGGVLAACGIPGPIRSPTYTLIEPYEIATTRRRLYHLDLYRLRSPLELEELGVRELLSGTNVLLVEWIENAPDLAALCDLHVQLLYRAEGRVLQPDARSEAGRRLLHALVQQ